MVRLKGVKRILRPVVDSFELELEERASKLLFQGVDGVEHSEHDLAGRHLVKEDDSYHKIAVPNHTLEARNLRNLPNV